MHRSTTRRLIRWLAGSVVAGTTLSAAVPMRPSQPYLASIAPLPLRFLPPPPDLSTDPAPAAPPIPDGVVGEVAQSNLEAVAPVAPEDVAEQSVPTEPMIPEAPTEPSPAAPSTRPPVEIIPDDLRREVMPEDVLPFFVPPQLPSAPASRATYRQT